MFSFSCFSSSSFLHPSCNSLFLIPFSPALSVHLLHFLLSLTSRPFSLGVSVESSLLVLFSLAFPCSRLLWLYSRLWFSCLPVLLAPLTSSSSSASFLSSLISALSAFSISILPVFFFHLSFTFFSFSDIFFLLLALLLFPVLSLSSPYTSPLCLLPPSLPRSFISSFFSLTFCTPAIYFLFLLLLYLIFPL